MKIAIQGELGSFSHEAALRLSPGAEIVPCATAEDVLRTLHDGEAKTWGVKTNVSGADSVPLDVDAAVIPVENSLAGSVIAFYDLFSEHEFTIERELQLRIRHNLIAAPGTHIESVREALSHPVALAQCKQFFASHPRIAAKPFYDTAGSVQQVMRERRADLAAIASQQAATQYGAQILQEGIEDRAESYTRFWLIRRPGSVPTENSSPKLSLSKLSLVFSLENRPGALLEALAALAARRLNLTKIESRPVLGHPWEYIFYADVAVGGAEDADAVIEDLTRICPMVKELGRYPAS